MTFPPEEHRSTAQMLGGLPAAGHPRHARAPSTTGRPTSRSFEEGNTEFGGFLKRLLFENGVAETGPARARRARSSSRRSASCATKKKAGALSEKEQARLEELATSKDVNIPFTVQWTEGSGHAEIEIQGTKLDLKAGEWSAWVPAHLQVQLPREASHGMTQFHVHPRRPASCRSTPRPVNLDPRDPPIPISEPRRRSRRSSPSRSGLYRTLGWAESRPWPLNEGRLDEATFLYDSDRAIDDREKIIFKSLEDGRLGPVRGRHRDHRPRLAHDVAAHRSQAPDVRRGAGREVRRRHREGLPPRRRPRRARSRRSCRRTRSSS